MYTFLVAAHDATETSKQRADYVCSGFADEGQIHAAMLSLPAAGGHIALSEGTFQTANLLNLNRANVRLSGTGRDATRLVIGTGLELGIYLSASNISIEDLCLYAFDGDRGSFQQGTHLIDLAPDGLSNLTFRRLRLEHARNGLRWQGNQNIIVEDVYCKDLGGQGIGTMGGSGGRAEHVMVKNCVFENVAKTGLTMTPVKNAVVSDILIIGGQGRLDVSSSVYQTENVTISNVVSVNAGGLLECAVNIDNAPAYPRGIAVSNCVARNYSGFPGIQGKFAELTLSNCIFQSDQDQAINIVGVDRLHLSNVLADATGWQSEREYCATVNLEDVPGAAIDNLTIIGSPNDTSPCLYIGGDGVRVSNSTFKQSRRHGAYVGSRGIRFDGCMFVDNAVGGIRADADNGKLEGSTFSGNAGAADFQIPGFGGWQVRGNRFESTEVGRHYDESSTIGDGCLVSDNIFAGTPITETFRVQKKNTLLVNNVDITAVVNLPKEPERTDVRGEMTAQKLHGTNGLFSNG